MKFLRLFICYRRFECQYQHSQADLSEKPVIQIHPLPICTKVTSFSDCLVRFLPAFIWKTDVSGCLQIIYKSKIFKNGATNCIVMCILIAVK